MIIIIIIINIYRVDGLIIVTDSVLIKFNYSNHYYLNNYSYTRIYDTVIIAGYIAILITGYNGRYIAIIIAG